MRTFLVLVAAVIGLVVLPTAANAAPPANDDFANATVIAPSALPFRDAVDVTDATTEVDEPIGSCVFFAHTVWNRVTPSKDMLVRADVGGSTFFDTALDVFEQTGSGFTGLLLQGCASPFVSGTAATFDVKVGKTYSIQAGNQFSEVEPFISHLMRSRRL
jgi:hypothetical protein